ncbi:hypothetical protein G5V57_00245 [Nordella sp. HKS 07]|uniref:hypothetical protein n=1 Tax=Nordella sp. HKS 07 TaxID=2712222 RepID=UPI0013E1E62C|nr:hypothetical protein [Nordella sp. HKS 07]QIG46324.1 hypothetical protein G5V57_00245 [Nordella sp. HKS 07]
MAIRHLIICAMLAAFMPVAVPVFSDTAQAATQTTTKKKKKKPAPKKTAEPQVKKNFGAPRPGEPNAGWTDDCLFYYQVYGRTPPICGKYGRSFMTWD